MTKQNFDANKLRVASPCSVGWETMTGDDRVRRCQACELNVYNISEMSAPEIENLIANRESRLCIRLYKRADGTVLTKDCPVGFRAYRRRVTRYASASLAAILGLFSVSYGQKDDKKPVDASKIKIVRTINQENVLAGKILDTVGAVVSVAEIKLYKKGEKKPFKVASADDEGNYFFKMLAPGVYALEIHQIGFKKYKIINLEIRNSEESRLDVTLEIDSKVDVVGILAAEPIIDMTSSDGTTKITREMIERIPH